MNSFSVWVRGEGANMNRVKVGSLAPRAWKFRALGAAAAVAMVMAASTAQAAPLAPGGTTFPTLEAGPAGTLEAYMEAAAGAATFSGTVRSGVFDPGAANPLGGLAFYYQYSADPGSATAVARVVPFSFAGFATDVRYRLDGSTLAGTGFLDGTEIPVTADRDTTGINVGFAFAPPDAAKIDPSESSVVLIIFTDAKFFKPGFVSVINGGSDDVASFAPAVAEPSTLMLFGAGLLGLARAVRRKHS